MAKKTEPSAPELLRVWRQRMGISQTDAGKRFEVTQTTVSDWEAGKKSPHISAAIRIERVTGGQVPVRAWAPKEPPNAA